MLDLIKSLGKMSLMIFVPVSLNFSLHFLCDYLGCNHWTNLFGHNLACNACIDSKKIIKLDPELIDINYEDHIFEFISQSLKLFPFSSIAISQGDSCGTLYVIPSINPTCS